VRYGGRQYDGENTEEQTQQPKNKTKKKKKKEAID
jgi:hypothetical protein